jgi:MFS family permease
METKANGHVSIFPILLINFIGTMGYTIVLPFIVVLVLKMGGSELSYGFLSATYSFFQLIGSPILGRWSDNYGRKKILVLSELGTFAGWVVFLIALYLPARSFGFHSGVTNVFMNTIPLFLLFLARAVDGITGGNISVANAWLADASTREDRKRNFGKMSASANIGVIFGPALAGVLGATALGYVLPVGAAMFISLLSLITIIFMLKDVRPKQENSPADKGYDAKFSTIVKQKYISFFLILYFLIYLGFNFFYVAFPVYAVQKLHWDILKLGIFFSVLSAALVLVQGPLLNYVSRKISGSILVIAGCLLLGVGFVLFSYTSVVLIYSGLLFFALGNGIMWPSFLALLSNATEDKYQGAVQGFAGSAASLASIIGLISGAFLYRIQGGNVFWVTTAFMVLIAIISYRLIPIEKATA